MKIFVAGTRGIPGIPGGVEKHCQELYPRIVLLSRHEIIVATRWPYVKQKQKQWQGVTLCHILAPHQKKIEAIVHTFLAVIQARRVDADIIHIHGIGPGLMVPFARLLGLRVVFTNHGPDYDRDKWSGSARVMLQLGEYLSGIFANEVIVISEVIANIVKKRCKRDVNLIYNGVPVLKKSSKSDFLEKFAIRRGNYLLVVARFVPEKGLHDLLSAFKELHGAYQLVIAGDADHETQYSLTLKEQAREIENVIMTGYVCGEELNQLYSHARLFVLPSYHEGLPIALLEAMSYGLQVLVSDIPANIEIALPEKYYFRCGDCNNLKEKIELLIIKRGVKEELEEFQIEIVQKYNWFDIAEHTIRVYRKAVGDLD